MKRKILISAISAHLFLFLGACNQQQKLEGPFPTGPNAPLIDNAEDVTNEKITQPTPEFAPEPISEPTPEPTAVESRPIIPPPKPKSPVQAPTLDHAPIKVAPQLFLSSPKPPKPPTPLKPNPLLAKKWVHKGGPLTKLEFLSLLKFGENDPAVQSLITDALKPIGGTNPEDLANWVQVCPKMNKLGEYITRLGWYFESFSIAEILDPTLVAKHIQNVEESVRKEGGEIVATDIHKSYVGIFYLEKRKQICLPVTEKSYEEVYLTLVHELVHFSRTAFVFEITKFLDFYPDKDSYIKTSLTESKDEMDAFATMFQVQIRLDHSTSALPKEVKGAFSEQGELINKEKLYNALISWQYADFKSDEYIDRLKKMEKSTLALDENLEEIMLERIQFQMGKERSALVQTSFGDIKKDSDDVEDLIKRIGERLDKKE